MHCSRPPNRTGLGSAALRLCGLSPRRALCGLVALGGLTAGTGPLHAATLQVGQGGPYATPSSAIAAAHDGDTVLIAPGSYFDCAIVRQNNLTIAGSGPDGAAVLTDKSCAGKASLVIDGRNITVRNLTLTRIRVPDGNGAGIRAEGHDLTVDHVKFINDQDGILAASQPDSTLTVEDSRFQQDGGCDPRCGAGIEGGTLRMLRVVNTIFAGASGGSHIRSAARDTVLSGDRLEDPAGAISGPLVMVAGGSVEITNTAIVLGRGAPQRSGAVLLVGDAAAIVVRGNTLQEPAGLDVPLVRNWTGVTAIAADNHVPPGVLAVSDAGSTYHRLRSRVATWRDDLRATAGHLRHLVAVVVHKIM